MKNWQTYIIVWAILELVVAVRSLNPNPSVVIGIVSTLISMFSAYAFFMAYKAWQTKN